MLYEGTQCDFEKSLMAKGYDDIGSGCQSNVYVKGNIVLKVCWNDKPYLTFARRIRRLKNPYFPKIKSIRHYNSSIREESWTVIKMEKLNMLEDYCVNKQFKILEPVENYIHMEDYVSNGYSDSSYIKFDDLVVDGADIGDKAFSKALEIINEVWNEIGCVLDLHGQNVMVREEEEGKNYRLVFTDPLFQGWK